ncbi:serine carboxypeptidase-like 18 [Olea europaea var. sylvestris]|uniref:serine carboxypeptidase-like 18 n=1 Tax=Olea europaea var. sylvestris TaxID=158386 RepID=UPI000C1CDE25|nr:serine carboxypeptidase-like 18 [Olea europaea var. sylvestris]
MNWIQLHAFLLLLLFNNGTSQSIIGALPGYSGTLPIKLETGYIAVGENDERQLFYYFVESEDNPNVDPLLFWITGGPGCSGLSSLVYEIGPLAFDIADFDGSLPSILRNPYSWTKVANIIFIDWPVGSGFSYANTAQGYSSSDSKSSKDNYTFLRKWLLKHPRFIKNRLYVGGESYGGKLVPMIAMEILLGNKAGLEPQMSFQGYIIGSGLTDPNIDFNERIPYAHRMALISDEYFESAKVSCDGKYYNPDPNNLRCLNALQSIQEPQNYLTSYVWANDPTVQVALHTRKGTVTDWTRCNHSLYYEEDVESVLQYYKLFSNKAFEVLIYNGDHDMVAPYMGPLKWIRSLNMTVFEDWRPWQVDGQVAGYTEKYKKNEFFLTFATVKARKVFLCSFSQRIRKTTN